MSIQIKSSLNAITLTALFALASCATHIEVTGAFPRAISEQLPINSVLVFDNAFRTYKFEVYEGKEVSIAVGQTQVDLFTVVANSMFEATTVADAMPTSSKADLIVVPNVEDVQISIPYSSQLKVFEVWIKYNLQVFGPDGEPIADWIMTAYGKTPTKFLKSDGEALNQAAIVALRDAGAHFIIGFARVPEISQWLDGKRLRSGGQSHVAL